MNDNLTELLRKYSTEPEDMEKLLKELHAGIEQRKIEKPEVAVLNTPQIFDWEEARGMGIPVRQGWMLKLTPDTSERGYKLSFLTPEKWEITEDWKYISPEGKAYDYTEMETVVGEHPEAVYGELPPEEDLLGIVSYLESNPEEFMADLMEAGRTTESEDLLKQLGASEAYIDYVFMSEEEQNALLYDIYKAGRSPASESMLKDIFTDVTEEQLAEFFVNAPQAYQQESKLKNIWDAFYSGMANRWYGSKQYLLTELPLNILSGKSKLFGGYGFLPTFSEVTGLRIEESEKFLEGLRDKFRQGYIKRKDEYAEWVEGHPELRPPPEWEGGTLEKIQEAPGILKDPAYWAYVAADTAAFTLAFLGTTMVVGGITRNPFLGLAAGVAVTTPAQSHDLYEDLLMSGATEEQATDLSVPIGALISSIEVVGGMPVLKAIFPSVFQGLRRNVQREIARRTIGELTKRGVTTVTKIELAEIFEEIVQGAIQDATVKTIDENRELLANIPETTIRTAMATLPLALIGGGSAVGQFHKAMSPELKADYDGWVAKLKEQGIPEEQAKIIAAGKILETPEGQEALEKAMGEVDRVEITPEVAKPKIELRKEQPNVWTIYRDDELVGNVQFERVGRDKAGANLRWIDPNTGEKQSIHLVGASEQSVEANIEKLVEKHIPRAIPKAVTEAGFKTVGRMPSGEANLLQTPEGVIIERIATGKQKGWWKIIVGNTEYVGKTPESVLEIAHSKGAIPKAIPIHATKGEAEASAKQVIFDAVKEEANLEETQDVVKKLTDLIKNAEPIREATEKLKHEELVKRSGRAASILRSAEGKEAFEKSKAALKGELPRADFAPPELQLTDGDIKALYDAIRDADLRYFEQLNTAEALTKLLSGNIPTSGELKLLEDMFGGDLVKAVMDKRTAGQKAWEITLDVLNIPRAVLASWDLSAPLRQGALLFWGQPKESVPALRPMVISFFSKKHARTVDEIIRANPYYNLSQDSGLYVAPLYGVSEKITQREEAFMSRFARYFPLVSHSERAYVTYLNKLRMDVFASYARAWEGTSRTVADYKALARAINVMSGRGLLGKMSEIGGVLNAALFSPRYQASRIMLPIEFVRATPVVRKMMARGILSFVMANCTILTLWVLADDDASVELDPRSTDFGKLKIGNTRLDFWAGFQQYFRTIVQIITGMRKISTTGKLTEVQRDQVVNQFVRSKLSPVFGFVADLLKGETFVGDELSLEPESVIQQARERLVPMFVQDLIEAIEETGLAGGLLALPGMFGVGVQTYGGGYWDEFIDMLGQPKQSDTLPYSVNKEDIYDTKDFYGDISPRVSGIKPEDIDPKYHIPDLVQSVIKAKAIKEEYQNRPSSRYVDINSDFNEGDTFEEYFLQWQAYQKATTDEERVGIKEKYPQYYIGNFSRQTLALLREYYSLDKRDQAEFLKDHPELKQNPREEWLKSHPEDNALLALWGQAKIYSLEAYNDVKKLIDELDIPGKAVEFNLPPKDSIENYFKYLDTSAEFGSNSWEVRRLLLDDDPLRDWLGRELIEDNPKVLDLQIKNRELSEEYEGYGDKDSPYYISNDEARDEAREAFKLNHPEWVADEHRIDAYKAEFPEGLIDDYVTWYTDFSKKPEDFEGTWYADDRWLMEHREFYNTMLRLGIWTEERDFTKVPTVEQERWLRYYDNLPKHLRLEARCGNKALNDAVMNKDWGYGLQPLGDRCDKFGGGGGSGGGASVGIPYSGVSPAVQIAEMIKQLWEGEGKEIPPAERPIWEDPHEQWMTYSQKTHTDFSDMVRSAREAGAKVIKRGQYRHRLDYVPEGYDPYEIFDVALLEKPDGSWLIVRWGHHYKHLQVINMGEHHKYAGLMS